MFYEELELERIEEEILMDKVLRCGCGVAIFEGDICDSCLHKQEIYFDKIITKTEDW